MPAEVILTGRGVTLVPLRQAHAAGLVHASADGRLWESTVTTIPDTAGVSAYIGAALAERDAGNALPLVITLAASGAVVGCTRFFDIDEANRHLEIGYTWIAASHQGGSVNPEIKYLMLCHAFEQLGMIRVQFRTDVLNEHSKSAILKLGALFEGITRCERIMPDGRRRDTAVFSILDHEWPAVKARLEQRLAGMELPQ
ncbi:MAG TPA: GNAT family protein [Burkholderiales bacterium]|nr:GNAT family protein [Burkholderiales bacterium]